MATGAGVVRLIRQSPPAGRQDDFAKRSTPSEKPAVARRLKKLKASAEYAAIALQAMDEGFQDDHGGKGQQRQCAVKKA
jgi:hypothetical protein